MAFTKYKLKDVYKYELMGYANLMEYRVDFVNSRGNLVRIAFTDLKLLKETIDNIMKLKTGETYVNSNKYQKMYRAEYLIGDFPVTEMKAKRFARTFNLSISKITGTVDEYDTIDGISPKNIEVSLDDMKEIKFRIDNQLEKYEVN